MKHIDYAYTHGVDDSTIDHQLKTAETGVLALADGDDAYAVPLAHYYDGEHLYFRLGSTPESKKHAFWEATNTACYVVYGTEPTKDPKMIESWSITCIGSLQEVPASEHGQFDTATINRQFAPIRVFTEPIEDIEITILKLEIDKVTGRATMEAPVDRLS